MDRFSHLEQTEIPGEPRKKKDALGMDSPFDAAPDSQPNSETEASNAELTVETAMTLRNELIERYKAGGDLPPKDRTDIGRRIRKLETFIYKTNAETKADQRASVERTERFEEVLGAPLSEDEQGTAEAERQGDELSKFLRAQKQPKLGEYDLDTVKAGADVLALENVVESIKVKKAYLETLHARDKAGEDVRHDIDIVGDDLRELNEKRRALEKKLYN